MKRKDRRQSGQILVIAVLVVSLVILSTQVYIFEVSKPLEVIEPNRVNDFVFALELGSKHVVTGSLAKISMGSDNFTLQTNLDRWVAFIGNLYQFGKPVLKYTLRSVFPYANGTYLSWSSSGFGISSAFANLNLSLSDHQMDIQMPYRVNVTTALSIEGVYNIVQGTTKQVNVTINVMNEDCPALAKNVTILFQSLGTWHIPNSQEINYGNGTYLVSFEIDIPGENVFVSAQVFDLREIYVQANTTCTNTS